MNILSSIILGIVQGLTEFLPVSSSGHLVISQTVIPGFTQPGVLFDVILHAGTLLAVLVYFRNELPGLSREYLLMIIVGTIPAVLVGLFFSDVIEKLFASIKLVGYMLIITAIFDFMTDLRTKTGKTINNILFSIIVGVFQAFAIIPGISRSGSTIFAGSKMGMSKKKAAEFSFLLSVPAVFGANIYEVAKLTETSSVNLVQYFVGFAMAFVTGYLSINIVLKALSETKFKYFSFYCLILGLGVIIFG